MRYNKIIFERITSLQFPILSYYLGKHKGIEFFDNDNYTKNRNWVRNLIKNGKIAEIPPIGYVYSECYGTALDNVDRVYEYLTRGSTLIREVVKVYGDKNIELAYKKELTRNLSEFYYINSYLDQEARQLQHDERILFIPYKYGQYLRLVRESGASYHDHQNIDIACASGMLNHLDGLFEKVKWWLFQLGLIALHSIKLMMPRKRNGRAKRYEYAVAIINADYQFKFKTRPVDFLLDGNNIQKDNTVFILLTPTVSRDNRDEMKSRGLNVIDCSKRFTSAHSSNKKDAIRILRTTLPYIVKHAFLGLFEDNIVLKVNAVLLSVFLKWSFILQEVTFKHFIILNDEAIDHVGRNILLNKAGAKTWYYAHSGSLGYLIVPPDSNMTNRHWLWSFLYYDNYISWNNEIIEYYKLHPQRIKNYVSIGCIWSSSIVDIMEGRIASQLSKEIFTDFGKSKYKTVAFFDSSYLPNSFSPLEDGVFFYQCILKLLEEFPNILIIIKEKKAEETVLDLYGRWGGDSNIFHEQYKPALDKLREHPRCYVTGYKGDPSEIIAMSDLTITYAFSSSTVEALCAGKKAVFFDPNNRWRGYRYDRIPNLVAHNYEELKRSIQKLLYETTEEEFSDFLNTHVKGVMDPYLDGKALTRFRKLLEEQV